MMRTERNTNKSLALITTSCLKDVRYWWCSAVLACKDHEHWSFRFISEEIMLVPQLTAGGQVSPMSCHVEAQMMYRCRSPILRNGQTSVNALPRRRRGCCAHDAAGGKCAARGTCWRRSRTRAGHAAPRHLATAAEVRQLLSSWPSHPVAAG